MRFTVQHSGRAQQGGGLRRGQNRNTPPGIAELQAVAQLEYCSLAHCSRLLT